MVRGELLGSARRRRVVAATAAALAAAGCCLLAAQASAYIYWADANVHLGRASLDGKGVDVFFVDAVLPSGLAVDAEHIYWSSADGQSIGRANLDGTDPNPSFITDAGDVRGVAVDAEHIYWANRLNDAIGRANLDGTDPNPSFIGGAPHEPHGVAVDAEHIYWTAQDGFIGRASLDGTNPNSAFIGNAGIPQGIAVDAEHIYWTDLGFGMIGRANLDGTDPNPSFIHATDTTEGVAVDAEHVYWASRGTGAIGRASLDGTVIEQSFIGFEGEPPVAVAVDSLRNASATTVACAPTPVLRPGSATCTATVSDTGPAMGDAPHGTVAFNSSGPGSFGPTDSCSLVAGGATTSHCQLTYTPSAAGEQTITAAYSGEPGHSASGGDAALEMRNASATTVACIPAEVLRPASATCTVTVADIANPGAVAPLGTVAFSSSGPGAFAPAASCVLVAAGAASSSCQLPYTPLAVAGQTITAAYSGDARHPPSGGHAALEMQNPSATTIACTPAAPMLPESTTCTVTVTDTAGPGAVTPLGTVDFSSTGSGSITPTSSCSLIASGAASSSCELTYAPSAAGERTIGAAYRGDADHPASSGEVELVVKPQNSFKVSRPKLNRRRGTAALTATVPGPGTLLLAGKGVRRARRSATARGRVKLAVKPKGKSKRKLARAGKARVVARVTYTPTGGDPNSTSKRITLKQRRR